VVYGINHLDLLGRARVYTQIKRWLAAPARPSVTPAMTPPPP
jgi:hypothetical protein